VGFVGLCLLAQLAGVAAVGNARDGWYLSLQSPPLTPPRWILAPISVVLDLMLGTAAWLIWRQVRPWQRSRRPALRLWGWQVGLTAAWTPTFFGLHSPGAALIVIGALLAVGLATLWAFWQRNAWSAVLLLPTWLWLCYGAFLNAGFWWLNTGHI
jgi:benzodiazapine receptor